MKLFKNIFDNGHKIISSFTKEDPQQVAELKRLEEEIKQFQEAQKKEKKEFRVTNRDMVKFWGFGMAIAFLGYILFSSLDIIYLIIAAYIVSIAIEAIIMMFEKYRISRGIAITISYILLIVFLLSGFVLVVPFMINQFSDIINIFVAKLNTFQTLLHNENLGQIVSAIPFLPKSFRVELLNMVNDPSTALQIKQQLEANVTQFSTAWKDYAQSLGTIAVDMVSGFVGGITKGSIVITLAVLFSIEKISVMKFISSLGGEKKFKYIYMKLEKIYKQLGIWLKARLLLSLYMGIALYVSFWILELFGMEIPSKASLALIFGVLDIVPYIGNIIGGIPPILLGLTHFGILGGLIITGILLVINAIENNVIVPLMMNKSLGINSVVIFISMILGGIIMGFLGILLAVPIAAIVTLLFEKELTD